MEVQGHACKMLSCPKAEIEGELPWLLPSLRFLFNLLPKPDRNWWSAAWNNVAGVLKARVASRLAINGQPDTRSSHAFSVLDALGLLLVASPSL